MVANDPILQTWVGKSPVVYLTYYVPLCIRLQVKVIRLHKPPKVLYRFSSQQITKG
ncbi:hypothetical protein HNR67_001051 [Crossiella cryophila]|uniref:Uncharacterized protein n=1 Tax=Crossiella cryophila TaxID=43355 RepID=A0A7W7FS11_9PSEU|nr:hypothetical protein [Crossiella cryophila]